jgi:hypothetical protein
MPTLISETRQVDGIFSARASADLVVVDRRAASTDLFLSYFSEIGLTEVLAAPEQAMGATAFSSLTASSGAT